MFLTGHFGSFFLGCFNHNWQDRHDRFTTRNRRTILNWIRIRWAIWKTHQFTMDGFMIVWGTKCRNLRSEFLTDGRLFYTIVTWCTCWSICWIPILLETPTNQCCSTGFSHPSGRFKSDPIQCRPRLEEFSKKFWLSANGYIPKV